MSFKKLTQLHSHIINLDCGDQGLHSIKEIAASENPSKLSEMKVIHRINLNEINAKTEDAKVLNKKRVFVGNIPFKAHVKSLKKCFKQFGKVVAVNFIKDNITMKQRGIAFVTFSNSSEALLAVKTQKVEYQSRTLRIFWAEESRRTKLCKEVNENCIDLPEEGTGETTTSILTNDCLLQIFSYLKIYELLTVRKVCRRWEYLTGRNLAAKRTLHFNDTCYLIAADLNEESFKFILKNCFSNLSELDLSSVSYFYNHRILEIIVTFCTNLEKVNFTNCHITDVGLKLLASNCQQLKSVILSKCPQFGENGLWWLLRFLPNLTHLDVSHNRRITGKAFYKLGSEMQKLHFSENHKLCDAAFSYISSKCKSLIEIQLKKMYYLKDRSFITLCQNCITIRTLVVTHSQLSGSVLENISLLPFLEELNLAQSFKVDDHVIQKIARDCKNLRVVNILGCSTVSSVGVQSLASCKKIENLDISYLHTVTDGPVSDIANNGKLRRLWAHGCIGLSSQSFNDVLNFCSRLEELDISSCSEIGDEILHTCINALQTRVENIALHLVVGGTKINGQSSALSHPLLKLNTYNRSNSSLLYLDDDFSYFEDDEDEFGSDYCGDFESEEEYDFEDDNYYYDLAEFL